MTTTKTPRVGHPPREPKVHHLKTVQPYFGMVWDGRKPFEIRKNDRDFRVHDILVLEEYDQTTGYTGEYIAREVTSLVQGVYGLPPDICVMGLDVVSYANVEPSPECNAAFQSYREPAEEVRRG